jgi:uncharacterized protein (TIGR03085 family)
VEPPAWDAHERAQLCDLLEQLGPGAPTLLRPWAASDLAAHLVQREHDVLAAALLVLPDAFQGIAQRRRLALQSRHSFAQLVATVRSGPPPGFFRLGWVRAVANLNEFFVHHEDLRRANGMVPRVNLAAAFEAALWRNVAGGGRYLARRLRGAGLVVRWAGTDQRRTLRRSRVAATVSGPPGEILLFLFGRQDAADVDVTGCEAALAALNSAHLGM